MADMKPSTFQLADILYLLGFPPEAEVDEWLHSVKFMAPDQTLGGITPEQVCKLEAMQDRLENSFQRWRDRKRAEENRRHQKQRLRQRAMELRLQQIADEIPEDYRHVTADNAIRPEQFSLVASYYTDGVDSRDANGQPTYDGLFLFGKSYQGKTAAAWEAWRRFSVENWQEETVFARTIELFALASNRFVNRESGEAFAALLERIKEAELLVLDDLFTERLSESAECILYSVLESRLNHRLKTIVTSNHDPRRNPKLFQPDSKNRDKIVTRIERRFLPVNFDVP